MATLTTERLETLLRPFLLDGTLAPLPVPPSLMEQLTVYLDLLLRWNGRTNLTAVREPEEVVRRHFGESLFAGLQLRDRVSATATLLDLGSGAGFPGLPMQLLCPQWQVTLAESQGKKASFLREAVRTLGLGTNVWDRRVEDMPPCRRFEVVALRAVDRMETAVRFAGERVAPGGWLAVLTSAAADGIVLGGGDVSVPVPESRNRVLRLRQLDVPRGT